MTIIAEGMEVNEKLRVCLLLNSWISADYGVKYTNYIQSWGERLEFGLF